MFIRVDGRGMVAVLPERTAPALTTVVCLAGAAGNRLHAPADLAGAAILHQKMCVLWRAATPRVARERYRRFVSQGVSQGRRLEARASKDEHPGGTTVKWKIGDVMHHPAQCAHPEWRSSADTDGAQAEQTRRDFLARYADRPTLVIGTHFATPTAGRIVRDGDSYRFAV